MVHTPADPTIESLRTLSICDLSDALLRLKVRNGGFLSNLTMWSPSRQGKGVQVAGKAYTVKYALNGDPRPKLAKHYIDQVPEGCVMFISCPPGVPNAVYGALMSTRAQKSGAVATIVDGRIRDLQDHRDLDYPVWAVETATAGPHELTKVVQVHVPVTLNSTVQMDMVVNPGDYLVADMNGVIVIPANLVEEAIAIAKQLGETDEEMAEGIKSGLTFTEASKKFRGQ